MAKSDTSGAERGLGRFEQFTDAVFAIAITLLIVDIKAPGSRGGPLEPHGLAAALADQWRAYLALAVSYGVIGVYWLQHHYSGRLFSKTDHLFTVFNLAFLGAVMSAPYPVRVWAEHIGYRPADERTAAIFLSWSLLAPNLGWMATWIYAVTGRRLVDKRLEPGFLRQLTWQYSLSTALLITAALLSLIAPIWGVGLSLVVTAAFALPPPRPRYIGADPGPEED